MPTGTTPDGCRRRNRLRTLGLMTALGDVAKAKYVLLTTYRKDGTPVGTPVWGVARDNKLYVWTETESWKAKRIGRNPAVTVQACDMRGKTTRGKLVEGSARLLDATDSERVRGWVRRKYWLTAPLLVLASKLTRGKDGTVGIEITPA
jgi:PPOX class probable F420-dependent enzyme